MTPSTSTPQKNLAPQKSLVPALSTRGGVSSAKALDRALVCPNRRIISLAEQEANKEERRRIMRCT